MWNNNINQRGTLIVFMFFIRPVSKHHDDNGWQYHSATQWQWQITRNKKRGKLMFSSMWALTDSNRRPSACKADALNQLS